MAAKKKRSKKLMADLDDGPFAPKEGDDKNLTLAKYWSALALSLGYNELAKLGKQLGDKVYFRLLRDASLKNFVEAGGHDTVFARESEPVMTITVDRAMPHILFRERDIELMRECVAKHDAERAGESERSAPPGGVNDR
jgi:hypothetical protein